MNTMAVCREQSMRTWKLAFSGWRVFLAAQSLRAGSIFCAATHYIEMATTRSPRYLFFFHACLPSALLVPEVLEALSGGIDWPIAVCVAHGTDLRRSPDAAECKLLQAAVCLWRLASWRGVCRLLPCLGVGGGGCIPACGLVWRQGVVSSGLRVHMGARVRISGITRPRGR